MTVGSNPTAGGGRAANGPQATQEGAARGLDSRPRPRLRPGRGGAPAHEVGRGPFLASGQIKRMRMFFPFLLFKSLLN